MNTTYEGTITGLLLVPHLLFLCVRAKNFSNFDVSLHWVITNICIDCA